jgi:hypothetical protein
MANVFQPMVILLAKVLGTEASEVLREMEQS